MSVSPPHLPSAANDETPEDTDSTICTNFLLHKDRSFANSHHLDSDENYLYPSLSDLSTSHEHATMWQFDGVGCKLVTLCSDVQVCSWEEGLQCIEEFNWYGTSKLANDHV